MVSAAQRSKASTVTRVAVAAIALVAIAALGFGSFRYSQVLKDRRIALEHLQQEKQAAAAAEQRASEEADKLKQQEEQAKAAAETERARQEELQRQQQEHDKQLAEANEKERQARLKEQQDAAAEKAKAEAAAQAQPANSEQATATDGSPSAVPNEAAATTQPAKLARGGHRKLAKASLPKSRGYHIDVDGVRDRGDAEALAAKLQKLGFSAYLVPSEDDDALWVVRVGPFRTQDEADAAEKEMTAKYQASFHAN